MSYGLRRGGVSEGLQSRRSGLEIRDCVLVVGPTGVRFAWLVREPMTSTVVEAVARTGRGALNIDACRIEGGLKQATAGTLAGFGGSASGHYEKGTGARFTSEGRFPSNTVLVHSGRCRRVGVRTVRGSAPGGPGVGERPRGVYGEGDPNSFRGNGSRVSYGDGTEDVPAWACECVVRQLDAQDEAASRYYAQHGDDETLGRWLDTLLGV